MELVSSDALAACPGGGQFGQGMSTASFPECGKPVRWAEDIVGPVATMHWREFCCQFLEDVSLPDVTT